MPLGIDGAIRGSAPRGASVSDTGEPNLSARPRLQGAPSEERIDQGIAAGSRSPTYGKTARTAIVIYFVLFGAVLGSFFNVLVYRLPLGMSLIRPGSHCPACERPVRWYDNVPVLSWFWLRGQCRDCQLRIAARYPAVEAATAVLFGAVAYVEVFLGGWNLPHASATVSSAGALGASWSDLQLIGICLFHLTLLSGLLCAALIEVDGHTVPWRLMIFVIAAGLVATAIWPFLLPVAAGGALRSGMDDPSLTAGAIDSAAGLLVAVLLAFAAAWRQKPLVEFDPRPGAMYGLAALGVFLGWQAVALIAAPAAWLRLIAILGRARNWRTAAPMGVSWWAWTPWLAASALAWILLWRLNHEALPTVTWLSATLLVLASCAAVTIASRLSPAPGHAAATR